MSALPLMVAWRLEGAPVLVVGGGRVGFSRARSLCAAGARVTVVAATVCPEIEALARAGRIKLTVRRYGPGDLTAARAVFVAIDEPHVARAIAGRARRLRIAVNVADVPELCDFYFCAVGKRGPLQVAVSTNGHGPGLAARVRDELVARLPDELTTALQEFSRLRRRLRKSLGLRERTLRLRAASQTQSWCQLATPQALPPPRRVDVTLVGAGPGDPDLLTVKARRVLDEADLIIADRLIPSAILCTLRGEVRVADKSPGRADASQAQIMRWLLDAARAGRCVVRLKIGDPFVFGRGGEEVAQLTSHGLSVEVVPGVTSALSAPLAAGFSVTMRGHADRVMIMSARGQGDVVPMPPRYHGGTTFVVLMGMGVLPVLNKRLLAQGFPADLPSACIVNATCPDERIIRATLADLPSAVRRARLAPPGVLVYGTQAARAAEANGTGIEGVLQPSLAGSPSENVGH